MTMPPAPPHEQTDRAGPATDGAPAVGTRLSAAEIHDNVRVAAEEELRRPAPELAWSGIAAGLTIGFSFVAGAWMTTLVPRELHGAANAVGYPLGFIFVVLARSQLFTENTLEPIIPLLNDRRMKTLVRVLRLWAVVLACNLAGALLFALVLAHTPVVSPQVQVALGEVAGHAVSGSFGEVAYLAIFAGWLIALMAWLVASTRATGAQILLIWLTTAPIAALGFPHSIAGAVEAFYLAATGGVSWGQAVGGFIVPAVLGNIVGGVTLVAFLNYGQVGAARSPWSARARMGSSASTEDP
jgi:formate/nitrite transporter FocA (FNT family)